MVHVSRVSCKYMRWNAAYHALYMITSDDVRHAHFHARAVAIGKNTPQPHLRIGIHSKIHKTRALPIAIVQA